MAIDSIGGFSSVNNGTSATHVEKKPTDNERAAVEINGTMSRSAELAGQLQKDVNGQDTFETGTSKENTENHIKSVLSVANQKIRMTNTRCEFEYHDVTKRVSIKVIDKETDEVVREIPPEKSLEMVEKMWELAGLIVDERR